MRMDLFLYLPLSKDYFLFDESGKAVEIIIPKGKLQELKGNKAFEEKNLKLYDRVILTAGKGKFPILLKKESGEIITGQSFNQKKGFYKQAALRFEIEENCIFLKDKFEGLVRADKTNRKAFST